MNRGFVSIETLAAYLDVSQNTVESWVSQGLLPAPRKIGERTRRWKLAEVDDWLDRGNNSRTLGEDMDHAIANANIRRSNKRLSGIA